MIELEGGEYIINAQTVNAVGTQFLDQLNSTATTYHRGGFQRGQLPGSNFRRGGRVRKKQTGGRVVNNNPITQTFNAPSSPRYYRPDGTIVPVGAPLHRHADGTVMTEHSMGDNDNSVVLTTNNRNNNLNGRSNMAYGRARGRRRMARGGAVSRRRMARGGATTRGRRRMQTGGYATSGRSGARMNTNRGMTSRRRGNNQTRRGGNGGLFVRSNGVIYDCHGQSYWSTNCTPINGKGRLLGMHQDRIIR
jgi:hypothetical protein